jgi:hypothetical protein
MVSWYRLEGESNANRFGKIGAKRAAFRKLLIPQEEGCSFN